MKPGLGSVVSTESLVLVLTEVIVPKAEVGRRWRER